MFFLFFLLYIFPDWFPYWSWVHLHCLFCIYPVFVLLRASMRDALIFPFTFSSECFHLIGAYRLWLSDSEFKREHLRELHIKNLAHYSFFQINFLISFISETSQPGWRTSQDHRSPFGYCIRSRVSYEGSLKVLQRGHEEDIIYKTCWIFIAFWTNDPLSIIKCSNSSWYSEWKLL